ncbi:MAG: hypothetical protein M1838_000847 [Thelocarpon superellum]|nr:MAG: hypothetical protein M1838_000847 [Thelocarpon superellum]
MALYRDAAAVLDGLNSGDESLKGRIYGRHEFKSSPAQVYALVSETLKWNAVLVEVIEKADLLKFEGRILRPVLALLFVHDLLLSRNGIATNADHPARKSIERHKVRLKAELARIRVKRGLPTLEAFREQINADARHAGAVVTDATGGAHSLQLPPRWMRINTLRATLKEQLETTFADYARVRLLSQVMETTGKGEKVVHIDQHIPHLLAVPSHVDLSKVTAYEKGEIIFQDKASCFPAYLLDPGPLHGDVLDACAAPGNKTTHLASLISEPVLLDTRPSRTIYAIEKDKARAATLTKMVHLAGAGETISVKAGQDFLRTDPNDAAWANVGALLLDPSCSGSGIASRGSAPKLVLPATGMGSGKKRKEPDNGKAGGQRSRDITSEHAEHAEHAPEAHQGSTDEMTKRLAGLSAFQLKILLHAFRFPAARRVTYSTCSIYVEENEQVVINALAAPAAQDRGWRLLLQREQVRGAREWTIRGDTDACRQLMGNERGRADMTAQACIRCNKSDEHGTMGFFVAAFVREETTSAAAEAGSPDEWQGFGDSDTEDDVAQ